MDKIAIITEFTYLYYLESVEQEFCNRGTQFCVTAGSTEAELMGVLKLIVCYTQTHLAYPNPAVFRVLLDSFELSWGQPLKPNFLSYH